MAAAQTLASQVGVASACDALSIPRASFYRHRGAKAASLLSSPRPHDTVCQDETAPLTTGRARAAAISRALFGTRSGTEL